MCAKPTIVDSTEREAMIFEGRPEKWENHPHHRGGGDDHNVITLNENHRAVRNATRNLSPFMAVLNILNTIWGSGVLALPFAMRSSGIVIGQFLLLGIAWLTSVSIQYLGESVEILKLSWDLKQYAFVNGRSLGSAPPPRTATAPVLLRSPKFSRLDSYEALGYHAFGSLGVVAVTLTFLVGGWGLVMTTLLLLVQCLLSFLDDVSLAAGTQQMPQLLFAASVCIVAFGAVLPLCLIRDLKKLRWVAWISVISTIYLALILSLVFWCSHISSTSSRDFLVGRKLFGIGEFFSSPLHEPVSWIVGSEFPSPYVVAETVESNIQRWLDAIWAFFFDGRIPWFPKSSGGVITSLAILMSSFSCHVTALPIYSRLKAPKKMNQGVIIPSIVVCYVVYQVIAMSGCLTFGPATDVNILNNLQDLYATTLTTNKHDEYFHIFPRIARPSSSPHLVFPAVVAAVGQANSSTSTSTLPISLAINLLTEIQTRKTDMFAESSTPPMPSSREEKKLAPLFSHFRKNARESNEEGPSHWLPHSLGRPNAESLGGEEEAPTRTRNHGNAPLAPTVESSPLSPAEDRLSVPDSSEIQKRFSSIFGGNANSPISNQQSPDGFAVMIDDLPSDQESIVLDRRRLFAIDHSPTHVSGDTALPQARDDSLPSLAKEEFPNSSLEPTNAVPPHRARSTGARPPKQALFTRFALRLTTLLTAGSLLASSPLIVWPMRSCLISVLTGRSRASPSEAEKSKRARPWMCAARNDDDSNAALLGEEGFAPGNNNEVGRGEMPNSPAPLSSAAGFCATDADDPSPSLQSPPVSDTTPAEKDASPNNSKPPDHWFGQVLGTLRRPIFLDNPSRVGGVSADGSPSVDSTNSVSPSMRKEVAAADDESVTNGGSQPTTTTCTGEEPFYSQSIQGGVPPYRPSVVTWVLASLVIIGGTSLTAVFIPSIEFSFKVVGVVAGSSIVSVFPAAFRLKLLLSPDVNAEEGHWRIFFKNFFRVLATNQAVPWLQAVASHHDLLVQDEYYASSANGYVKSGDRATENRVGSGRRIRLVPDIRGKEKQEVFRCLGMIAVGWSFTVIGLISIFHNLPHSGGLPK